MSGVVFNFCYSGTPLGRPLHLSQGDVFFTLVCSVRLKTDSSFGELGRPGAVGLSFKLSGFAVEYSGGVWG